MVICTILLRPNYFVYVIRDRQLIYLNIPSSELIPILSWSDGVHKVNEILLEQIRIIMTQTILIIQTTWIIYSPRFRDALTTFRRMQKKNAQIIFKEYVPLLLILVHPIDLSSRFADLVNQAVFILSLPSIIIYKKEM